MSRLARGVLIFTLSTIAAWAIFIAALLWLPAIGTPSGDAVRHSLDSRTGGGYGLAHACKERSFGVRICDVSDLQGSGGAIYRVRMDGRCWQARKISPRRSEEGSPWLKRQVSGCVEFSDQVRLFERAFE
jgi:hypothetical protein